MCVFWKACSSRPGVVLLLNPVMKEPAVALTGIRATTTGPTNHTDNLNRGLNTIIAPLARSIVVRSHETSSRVEGSGY